MKITDKLIQKIVNKYLTVRTEGTDFPETRETGTPPNGEKIGAKLADRLTDRCPYCGSKEFVKRGTRRKKRERVQLYLCKACGRTFTPQTVKGKHYPLKVILDGISLYNLGYTLEDSCRRLKESYGFVVKASTLSDWVKEFGELCRFERMRKFAIKMYSPEQMIVTTTLFHRQVFKYRYHQGKLALLLQEDFKHRKFWPLREYLEAISLECPHQYFKEGLRASELNAGFSMKEVLIRNKENFANRLAHLAFQTVADKKSRHDALQKFMLANDSVTVATEVPVYLTEEDIEHMQSQLGFKIPTPNTEKRLLITGHIDILQMRNGLVHIIDYKPNAARQEPIEQLTWYALALSRLTGLRLFDFKCAWFDRHEYFEFFPLHIVYKLKEKQAKIAKNQVALPIEEKK